MTAFRFELANKQMGIIGHYQSKEDAMLVALPGDSLFDRCAERGDVELWMVGGDIWCKKLMAIRRKASPGAA